MLIVVYVFLLVSSCVAIPLDSTFLPSSVVGVLKGDANLVSLGKSLKTPSSRISRRLLQTCNPGFFDSGGTCYQCPANSTSVLGSLSYSACTCNAPLHLNVLQFLYSFENASDLALFNNNPTAVSWVQNSAQCKIGSCVLGNQVTSNGFLSMLSSSVFPDPNVYSLSLWYKMTSSSNICFIELWGPNFGAPTWAANDYFSLYTASSNWNALGMNQVSTPFCCFNSGIWTHMSLSLIHI